MTNDDFGRLRRDANALLVRLQQKRQGIVDDLTRLDQQLTKAKDVVAQLGRPTERVKSPRAVTSKGGSANGDQVQSIITTILTENPEGAGVSDLQGLLYGKLRESGQDCKGAARIMKHVLRMQQFEQSDDGRFRLAAVDVST